MQGDDRHESATGRKAREREDQQRWATDRDDFGGATPPAPGTGVMHSGGWQRDDKGFREPSFAGPAGQVPVADRGHRGKGPKSFTRTDARIHEDVCHQLEDADLDASDIEVRVAEGEVTLEGTVHDRRAKRAAEDIAWDCRGVKQCHNLLRVGVATPSSGSSAPSGRSP